MTTHFHYTNSQKGLIHSLFFLGYMTTQIHAGILADRHGGRPVLAIAVLLWSLSTLAIPAAAHLALPVLLLTRVMLGAAEGAAMPAMNALVAASIPVQFRARSLSFIYSGMYAGSILGLLVAPSIIRAAGWEALFYIFGLVGIIWVLIFVLSTRSISSYKPVSAVDKGSDLESLSDKASSTGDEEDAVVSSEHPSFQSQFSPVNPTMREMLAHRAVWAIIVAHFCCTWGYFVLLSWLPTYLYSEFKLDVKSSAFLSATPWAAMFIFANIGGFIADRAIRSGVSVTHARKMMQSIGFIGPAAFLIALCTAKNVTSAMVYVSLALALASFSQSGVYANHQDIGPNVAGTLLGISNTFASIPGLVGVCITGIILDVTEHNWNAVFGIAIFFYMVGFVVYNLFATSERQW